MLIELTLGTPGTMISEMLMIHGAEILTYSQIVFPLEENRAARREAPGIGLT